MYTVVGAIQTRILTHMRLFGGCRWGQKGGTRLKKRGGASQHVRFIGKFMVLQCSHQCAHCPKDTHTQYYSFS